jgi:enoyl-CoA hydratase
MNDEVLYREYLSHGATIADLVLNRPEKGNALTFGMLDEIAAFCQRIARDKQVRAVVIRGNGRFFCTGGDIQAWGNLSATEMGQSWILRGMEVLEQIANLPQPVIAVLHGHTLGGGLELALAADLRVAVKSAKIGMPEVGLGMIAGWGGVRKLAETVGVARAREFLLLGAPITAEKAAAWGLVHAVAEDAAAIDTQVTEWLELLVANAPIAMALTKGLLKTMHTEMRQAFASAAAHAAGTADCKEGVQAFLEKRKPVYKNC